MPSTDINSKLPSEIFREIFLQCMRTVKPKDTQRSRSDLRLVCRHWRQIVESHACLWSTIYIFWVCDVETFWPPPPTVRLSLKLSRGAPLEIYALSPPHWLCHTQKAQAISYMAEIFPLLVAQVSRWQRLVLSMYDILANDIRSIAFTKAERLQDVDIEVAWEHDGGDSDEVTSGGKDIAIILALAGAPNLRSFKWNSDSDVILPHIVETFPLERLTRLHLEINSSMSFTKLFQVMQKCTSVVEMGIYIGARPRSGDDPLPLVVLPNLRTLELSLGESECDIFNYFDFPNLEVIIIQSFGGVVFDCGDDLCHYLSNSRHCIQVLLFQQCSPRIQEVPILLLHPAVCEIPIVQVHTQLLPKSMLRHTLKGVEKRLPKTRQPSFRIIEGHGDCEDEELEDSIVIGWTDVSTYEEFKDSLTDLGRYSVFEDTLCPYSMY